TAWTVSTPLLNGQMYFWIAVVTDEHGASVAGEPASFIVSTSNLAPSVPTISAPAQDEVVPSTTIDLVAGNATDPEHQVLSYYFELDSVDTFDGAAKRVSDAIAQGPGGTTPWQVEGLTEGQTYFWRVKASDGSAESGWA